MQVAAAVEAVAAADGENGVQWQRWGGAFDGQECDTMSGQDGSTTRVNAATIRHNETARGRCNERTMRGDATTSQRSKKTGGRRDERTRGPRDDRRLKNQLARQEDKRGARRNN